MVNFLVSNWPFLLVLSLFFLMHRSGRGCGMHGHGHQHDSQRNADGTHEHEHVTDPEDEADWRTTSKADEARRDETMRHS